MDRDPDGGLRIAAVGAARPFRVRVPGLGGARGTGEVVVRRS
ncbi:hypothetical protein [Streptomyces sp. CC210A]|nr:hypothetical protein [Streptomyces sp. CC210A]